MRGKGFFAFLDALALLDHPRVCGEKTRRPKPPGRPLGSPPRMRGKEQEEKSTLERVRITPAYAGKSDFVCKAFHPPEDHPRVCGEKWILHFFTAAQTGSPPRMRGKVVGNVEPCGAVGITPAYAGKSLPGVGFPPLYEDHPRVCGEKALGGMESNPARGSPPRMRGKDVDDLFQPSLIGITPAYAGKSAVHLLTMLCHRDHPRVCGEKFGVTVEQGGAWRITPAYAGKRLKKSHSTVSPVAIVPLFPSVCNRPVVSNGNPAERDAPLFLPAENTVPASPAYNLRSS